MSNSDTQQQYISSNILLQVLKRHIRHDKDGNYTDTNTWFVDSNTKNEILRLCPGLSRMWHMFMF